MVRFVPRDGICCFAVVNPILDIRTTPEFANIPTRICAKPNENWSWLPQRRIIRKLSSVIAFAGESFTEKTSVRSLVDKAVAFGREQKVDRVWVVLQGQTTIRMAQAVADKLGVPLHTHVWDPFSWWAKANCIDGITARRVQSTFDEAIRSSRCVATASEPMAELYRDRFKVEAVPVISSHSQSMAQTPDITDHGRGPIIIGMAGQFYAAGEWLQLMRAMRASKWTIAGRPVRIVVMGPQRPPGALDSHVSFLGWKTQPDAAFILSQCNILYCPYPFDPAMKEVSQFSFPSKLVLYLAAGRPIVFHGPAYSSPAHYIKSRQCGLIADRMIASAIYNELERLVQNADAYRTMAFNAQSAFRDDFTLESMERSFNAFIGAKGLSNDGGVLIHDHTKQSGADPFIPLQLSDASRRRSFVWIAHEVAKTALPRYAHFRRQLKGVVRKLLLKIPRLGSLYHEIHGLYAEKKALERRIAELEEKNARLNDLLTKSSSIGAAKWVDAATEEEVALVDSLGISPKFISGLYPGIKTLVFIKLPDGGAIAAGDRQQDNRLSGVGRTRFRYTSVTYVQLPLSEDRADKTGDEWDGIERSLPRGAVAELLRFVLQERFERLVVADNVGSGIAIAAEVAHLASQRLTVISKAKLRLSDKSWLASQDHIDYVDAASAGAANEVSETDADGELPVSVS